MLGRAPSRRVECFFKSNSIMLEEPCETLGFRQAVAAAMEILWDVTLRGTRSQRTQPGVIKSAMCPGVEEGIEFKSQLPLGQDNFFRSWSPHSQWW